MISPDDLTPEIVQILIFNWEMTNDDETISKRVDILFRDWRFSWLLLEWEMFEIARKIRKEVDLTILSNYLDELEVHIKNVDPHLNVVTVNDEDTPVFFITERVET